MATSGGGVALDAPIGFIEPGYQFDAIAVTTRDPTLTSLSSPTSMRL